MVKMIAVDLDGTLLGKNGSFPVENKEALTEASQKGIQVIISTGRILATCEQVAQELACASYLSTCNGSAIYPFGSSVPEKRFSMPAREGAELASFLEGKGLFYRIYCANSVCYSKDVYQRMQEYEGVFHITEGMEQYSSVADDLARHILENQMESDKFFILLPEGCSREAFAAEIPHPEWYTISSSWKNNLEITKRGVDKATGLKYLCEKLGIRREELMAVGDSFNDIAMLEYAGISVAMGNAEQAVKDACAFLTKLNTENGVAAIVRKLAL